MILILTIILLICLSGIFYQDISDRMVYWWLFPLVAVLFAFISVSKINFNLFGLYSTMNLLIVILVLAILYGYSRFILRKKFINHSFGLGDLFIFLALCFSYPTTTFIVLFSFSILFSLAAHLAVRSRLTNKSVPLAGYMALFFAVIILLNLGGLVDNLYLIY